MLRRAVRTSVFSVLAIALCAIWAGGARAALPPLPAGTLPAIPDGLNVALGAHVTATEGAVPGSPLSAIADGDGSTRFCTSGIGIHQVTVDLGQATDVTGIGVTFSGEESLDGSFYSVSAGTSAASQTPFPNQAAGQRNAIVQGPLYLFAGTPAAPATTVSSRYVMLSWLVPRDQNICVNELRVFSADSASAPQLELGSDLSTLAADTGSYTLNGTATPLTTIFKDGGGNYARLDLLVNPAGTTGPNLANDLALATQLQSAGMKIALNIEYSDSPTSATAQTTPAAWAGQDLPTLAATVKSYTQSAIAAFAANGTPVSQVALGNDIGQGILWPTGRLTFGGSADSADWSGLTTLLTAASQGATAGNPAGNPLGIELDIGAGADSTTSNDFLDHAIAAGVPFNVIGELYSPWQHGTLTELESNLRGLTGRYGLPVVLDAGQYPYANVSGYGTYSTAVPFPDTVPGYLISAAGQASYERDLVSFMATLPNHLGLGLFYATPDTLGSLGWFTTARAAQPAIFAYRVGSQAAGSAPSPLAAAPKTRHAAGARLADRVATASAAAAADPPPAPAGATSGPLPPMPMGLDVAIGQPATANSGSVAGSSVANVADGDGSNRWCASSLGVHQVTIDLGKLTNVTGTGITFSGETAGDGATYSVSTGVDAPNATAFPNQAAGNANPISLGSMYLYAGTTANNLATVPARYVTLTFQVPREENICVNELRVFAPATPKQQHDMLDGADISTLISDTGTYTDLNGNTAPILSIFKAGGMNYGRLRLWVNPGGGSNPNLANDLKMGQQIVAAGMGLEIDFHYSDTWADPQHQGIPAAWQGQTLAQLATTMHDYTESVVQAFAAQGTPPSMVSIGNEITQGLLWGYTTSSGPATTTSAATVIGATTANVRSITNFVAGQTVAIGTGTGQELATIATVGTNNLTFTAGLTLPHANASAVGVLTPAGATTLKVASTSGITAGDTLFLDSLATSTPFIGGVADPSTELVKVQSVDSATQLTLTSATTFAHVGAFSVQDQQNQGHLLYDDSTGKADFTALTTLLKAGYEGAEAGNPPGNPFKVQMHLDRGGDEAATEDFIDHLLAAGVKFDVLGLSYYSWYHGPMAAMEQNFRDLAARYHKPLMIAEDQYPQAPQGGYGTYSASSSNFPDTVPGYLVNPAGQLAWERDLDSFIASLPDGLGIGVLYWDADANGNLGLFTSARHAAPAIDDNQLGGTAIMTGSAANWTVTQPGSFTVRTNGVPTPSVTETGALPPGVTFTDNGDGTATIAGTPAPGPASVGTFPLTITASNGLSPDTQSFTLTVAPVTGPPVTAPVGGSVPATLSLSLGTPASFGTFTPGVAQDYTASMSANVISTAGDAALSVADPSSVATGHLVNGSFSLPSVLQAKASSPAAGAGAALANVGGSAAPTSLLSWANPASNDPVTIGFSQHIGGTDALRTGSYSKTLTFTLSTTTP
jgi:arabinogalactan endo-1,4-beta-galactosidase